MLTIVNALRPNNMSELRAYIGLLNYYGKFIHNLSTMLKTLHDLLKTGAKWEWTEQCQSAFERSKSELLSSKVLLHYDQNRTLRLASDAPRYSAVLSHVMDNGEERLIAFTYRSLSKSQRNYALIGKEALGLVFEVKESKKAISALAAARMQRCSVILQAYRYEAEYRSSREHNNPDALSRLSCKHEELEEKAEVFSYFQELPIHAQDISRAPRTEPMLARVLNYTLSGWPNYMTDQALKP